MCVCVYLFVWRMYNICVYFIVVVVVILGDKNDKKDVCSCPWPKLHHTAPQMVERSDADSGFACRICMQTNLRVIPHQMRVYCIKRARLLVLRLQLEQCVLEHKSLRTTDRLGARGGS